MTEFRVHFLKTDGDKTTHVVNAESPTQAAAIIRKKNPGITVLKVKVNKAGNMSVRDRNRTITDDDIANVQKHAEKHFGKPSFVRSSEPGWTNAFNVQVGDKVYIDGVGETVVTAVIGVE